ncbi:hypothetical protein SCP_0303160 [Sparassis crispa]|uniref:X-box-binding protein 1 n=1 Tax=Sparassis crispa TaxID=139825 RepID=A0A401GEN0_9APHY|nr:hypothetical protein SCP_0303160 [Sparassis crispa]GBE80601.1 hypothetical protein SCP_0303160 [Sparassis crispa]
MGGQRIHSLPVDELKRPSALPKTGNYAKQPTTATGDVAGRVRSLPHDFHVRPASLPQSPTHTRPALPFSSSRHVSRLPSHASHLPSRAMKRTADSDIELALPSPAASTSSPTPSVSELPGNTNLSTTTELGAPPRKRARGETSVEERKEARAHRNRIAAQNSRDRRKAQFAYLERRVAELEEENRQLRAGMGLVGLRRPQENSDRTRDQERERDAARDRENAELKERIKTLETGWDAVVKALAASGLPLNVPSIAPSASDPAEPPSPSSQPPTTTFSVFVPPSPIFPISPPPSHDSSLSSSPFLDLPFDDAEPTRHLARVANTDAPPLSSVPQQRVGPPRRPTPTSSSSSLTPFPPFQAPKHHLRQIWTRAPWRTSSAKSSRPRPCSRKRPCLILRLSPPPHHRRRPRRR